MLNHMQSDRAHFLLFDGDCEFCQKWAAWLHARDAQTRRFRIMPWQDAPSPPMTPLLQVQSRQAVQLITNDGRHLQGGQAALFALRETGWYPALVSLLERRPFVWLVDLGYRVVASNRPRFSWMTPPGREP